MQYDKKAKELRAEILKMLYACQSGHPGGSLSCVEMLMALYYEVMKVDPKNPKDPDRDRFVLSKGHACPTLYAILADLGFFPKEDLANLRQIDSHLQGHPDCTKTPGVDMNTGSLGQGASLAMGLALAAKHAKAEYKVYAVLGDGECQEGLVWEAAMAAAHYKLDNLLAFVDHNGLQIRRKQRRGYEPWKYCEEVRRLRFRVLRGGRPRHGRHRGGAQGPRVRKAEIHLL